MKLLEKLWDRQRKSNFAIYTFLQIFGMQINELYSDNLVITGSCVLELMGLELGRKPEDLDVILFYPNKWQQKLIEEQLGFNSLLSYEREERGERSMVWELKKGKYKMNILYSENHVPDDLLSIQTDFGFVKVSRIDDIIKAKLSYLEGQRRESLRRKDIADFINLKNLNFNL